MNKAFWMVCVTHMFVEIYFLIQVALIPVFVSEFKLSLLEASLVATIPSLIQLLMNLPSGFLTERFSTKHLLFASMTAEGFSALLVSRTDSFWMLVLGVSMMRLSSPLYHISGLSRISRLTRREDMSRSMGFHNALGSFGSAIGLVSLSVFLSTTGWRWIYLFWAFPIITWGFIILRSTQLGTATSETDKAEKRVTLKRLPTILSAGFLIVLVTIGLREVGNTGTSTYITTYLVKMRGFSESEASLVFGLSTFMGIAGSLYGGYLGEKIGPKKALSSSILCGAISLSALALTTPVYLLTLFYLIYTFFNSSVWSPLNTMVADITPRTERGLGYSVYFFMEGTIVSITPTFAAAVIGLSDIWHIFPFSITFLTASLVTLQLLSRFRKTPNKQHSQ